MHIKIYHRRKMLIVAAFIVGIGLVFDGAAGLSDDISVGVLSEPGRCTA